MGWWNFAGGLFKMRRKPSAGFTLLESLITSVIVFITISIAVMSFMAGSNNFASSEETIKAYQDCYSILGLISCELREADSGDLTSATVLSDTVTFKKYHRPTDETQTVTWSFDSDNHKAIRSYTGTSGKSGTSEFGYYVENMSFALSTRGTPPDEFKLVKVTVKAQAEKQSLGSKPGSVVELSNEVCVRKGLSVEAQINFLRP